MSSTPAFIVVICDQHIKSSSHYIGDMCGDMCHCSGDIVPPAILVCYLFLVSQLLSDVKVELKSEVEQIDYIDIKHETFPTSEEAELEMFLTLSSHKFLHILMECSTHIQIMVQRTQCIEQGG
ncbi:hypothetical protein L9F63_006056, partial [Diploptera punctata]